jgi:Flp pilus assembly protein TadB
MNGVEERLRAALHAHAEEFTAHPDAWRQLTARRRQGGRSRWRFRFSGSVLLPVAAAMAVVAAVAVAIVLVRAISGPAGQARSPAWRRRRGRRRRRQ